MNFETRGLPAAARSDQPVRTAAPDEPDAPRPAACGSLDPRRRGGLLAIAIASACGAVVIAVLVAGFPVRHTGQEADAVLHAENASSVSVGTGTTVLTLRVGDSTALATLGDTPPAHQLAGLLPLQLVMHDPMGQAKTAKLPVELDVSDVPADLLASDPVVGGLYYWPDGGYLAVFYDDLGQTVPPPGLIRLGTVTSGLDQVGRAGNRFPVSITNAPRAAPAHR